MMYPLSIIHSKKLGDNRCWYCGEGTNYRTKTADHFYPKSKGGRLKVVCCRNCNTLKADLTPPEFIEHIEHLKIKHRNIYSAKFNRMINATKTLWERVEWSEYMVATCKVIYFNKDHDKIDWQSKIGSRVMFLGEIPLLNKGSVGVLSTAHKESCTITYPQNSVFELSSKGEWIATQWKKPQLYAHTAKFTEVLLVDQWNSLTL